MKQIVSAIDAKESSGKMSVERLKQTEINKLFNAISKKDNLLPIKVTPFFKKKVEEETLFLGHSEGPLHRIVYPTLERLNVRAPGEVPDFVDDRNNMPDSNSFIIQKYENRLLFLPTSTCAAHCQYCFRQDVLSEQHDAQSEELNSKLNLLEQYLLEKPLVKEVILSGGDPMTLPPKQLQIIIERLKLNLKIESIRIHTKTISYSPNVFNEEKLKLFSDYNVRLVFHLAHPYEICDVVEETIYKIKKHNIKCYNQFPILRKINDHHEVLIKHLGKLELLNIRNLSIFIPDPINYSASFRIRLSRLFNIIDNFNWKSPSWINSTRFVLDSHIGKVRREDMKSYDEKNEMATFVREGKQVLYPDFPEELDIPGDLETLLWKEK